MFDYDKWQEIFATIQKNKLRTFLTVFGIGWGIFMIVILLGVGKGLQNGVNRDFAGWAGNAGFFWTQRTTISHAGFKPGRRISFTNEDTDILRREVKNLEILAPRNRLGSRGGGNRVIYKDKSSAFSVFGDYPGYFKVQLVDLVKGRLLNDRDIEEERKVAVVGQRVVDVLFGDEPPIGKFISINKVNFKIIGVFKSFRTGEDADNDTENIFTPFTTFQKAFKYGNSVSWYGYLAKEGHKVSEVEASLIEVLKKRHRIHPDDKDAIGAENLEEEFEEISGLFQGMKVFTWFVGISTLFAGVIGISNIMLIIVKERTKEIGIRKSLGATPMSIVSLIIQESVFLTTIGGYVSLVVGIFIIELLAQVVPNDGFMGKPETDIGVAVSALGILIVGGAIAGILPATKAAVINPIEAIRNE